MTCTMRTTAVAVSLGLVLALETLGAQQAEPASIPTVLATVLSFPLSRMVGDRPHYVVGRTPPGWPSSFVTPASATLIGGVKFGPMLGAVYRFPRQVDAPRLFQKQFAVAGYTRHEVGAGPHGGFMSGQTMETVAWCSPNGTANVAVFDSTATSRLVLVSVASAPATSRACDPPESRDERAKPPLAIPPLTAPLGVLASANGSGWSGDDIRTSVSVDTTLSADSLLGHYAAQLRTAGWQAGKRLSDGRNAFQPWTVRDPNGKQWVGAMTLVTGADRRSIILTMAPASREQ